MVSYISKDELKKMNEKERRLTVAAYAIDYGRGGITEMNRRYGLSRTTISKGIRELKSGVRYDPNGRTREKGAGRKFISESKFPELDSRILKLAGKDPSHPDMSIRKIVRALEEEYGIQVSRMTVYRTLEKYR